MNTWPNQRDRGDDGIPLLLHTIHCWPATPHHGRWVALAGLALVVWNWDFTCTAAGTSTSTNTASPPYFRLSQLEEAKVKPKAEGKPIVWIASFLGSMTAYRNLMGAGSHAATYHAYLTFYRDAVVVWSDSAHWVVIQQKASL